VSINYAKPARSQPRTLPSSAGQLQYWIDRFHSLTDTIQAATVTNADPMRKGQINTRALYSQRAAAASQMATHAQELLRALQG